VITREQLQAELDALEAQREQALAALNALVGAINLCRALLAAIDAPTSVEPEPRLRPVKEASA
jgi:hypothetical protein